MGAIIFILAIVIIGFWFFPNMTRQVLGSFVKNAEPITDKVIGLARKAVDILLNKV